MTREEKRKTLQMFENFPPVVRMAIVAGKVLAELEKQASEEEPDEKKPA